MVNMRRSFFRMQPKSKKYFTQWMYDVWRNKFLFWSIWPDGSPWTSRSIPNKHFPGPTSIGAGEQTATCGLWKFVDQGFENFLKWCIDKVRAKQDSAHGHFRHAGLNIEVFHTKCVIFVPLPDSR
ncbi:Probable transposable element [Penicillium roqueforti FM164]|uniref:Probable transposable element n=1 Tax=Penicillium roqueforti (strain FM164) TaxID=1365484 RepID=W6Q7R7_PENRF|nr:Probable transposable element [Penicillium roqueforti FM164]